MSRRRSTLSPRRVALLVILGTSLAATAGLLATLTARTSTPAPDWAVAHPEPPTGPGDAGGRGNGGEMSGPAASPTPTTATPDPASQPTAVTETPAPPTSDTEVIEGQQVAADFASAYASYRFDDGPSALIERLRGLVTAELAEALTQGSGGVAGRLELAARREIATATVESVQPQTIGDGWMDLLVVVRADVVSDEGAETRWGSYLTRVVRSADGWRVAGFQP